MENLTIAAVIPLYNGKDFIAEALRSVLSQTVLPDEVIVVDDGSTDDGADIVRAIALENDRVRLLTKSNGGQSSARNLAIRSTQCTHIALLDQDDVWYDDHIAILKAAALDFDRSNLALIYGDLDQMDETGRMFLPSCLRSNPSPQPKRSLLECLSRDMFILPGASLVLREAILDVGMFDERLSGYEDDDLFLRLFLRGYRSLFVPKGVTKWRIHSGSTSYSPRMDRSRRIYFGKLVEMFPDDPRLEHYWIRDAVAPRFLGKGLSEFVSATRAGDRARMEEALRDMDSILPYAKRKVRRRSRWLMPLIRALGPTRFDGLARTLARLCFRDRPPKPRYPAPSADDRGYQT
ncbi:glycosyltransferase family 2 protein [Kaistia defluvii]|uniref:Glycosyltransferase involved in cell wall biosynthesis n=1 Tax=Kaistia defluvii TaxID=410841 RepID=A0ABV2R0P0_9HYPH